MAPILWWHMENCQMEKTRSRRESRRIAPTTPTSCEEGVKRAKRKDKLWTRALLLTQTSQL